ncbi:unnamed protein product [Danaus chrysippus]|uniref:(African queen) hypothetical protein n=1 Tax=Danaus chrysippus TaxID=151541 RepID=A0A8J2R4R1_9NEOP|nr:unnamed protein product [Danaus chrysippus]
MWVLKSSGKELAIINGFTFYLHKRLVKTDVYSCTHGSPCTARVSFTNDHYRTLVKLLTLAKSRYTGKQIVILDNYTYYCKKLCKKTNCSHWYCSTNNWKGCNAKLKLDENFGIIEMSKQHTHPPARYRIHNGLYYFQLLPLPSGRCLLRIGDDTYSTNSKNINGFTTWYCSKRLSKRCPVKWSFCQQNKAITSCFTTGIPFGVIDSHCFKASHVDGTVLRRRVEGVQLSSEPWTPTEIVIGSKGKEQLLYNGYKYYNRGYVGAYFFMASNGRTQMIYKDMKFYQQPEGQDRIRWRCTKRGCRAFYFTIAGIIVRSQERHNHEDPKNQTEKKAFKNNIR